MGKFTLAAVPSSGPGGKDTSWGAATKSRERGNGGGRPAGSRAEGEAAVTGRWEGLRRAMGAAGARGEGGGVGGRFGHSFWLFHLPGRDHTSPAFIVREDQKRLDGSKF